MKLSAEFVINRHHNGSISEVYDIVHCLSPSGDLREAIHGSYASFFDNGRIRSCIQYRYGEIDGRYNVWYPNGLPFIQCEYVNGKRHGKLYIWYDSGMKKLEGFYKDGLEHGSWIFWNKNGEKEAVIEFNEGKKISGPEFPIVDIQPPA